MRRLPPLRALEAFTRVARLGSSKAAAAELALSAPALSRRIKSLEDHIGKPLFERRNQSMVLNDDGKLLLETVSPALENIAEAVNQMTVSGGDMRLRLGVLPLFGATRLLPKLNALKKLYPKLHIDVDTSAHAENILGDSVDAAIIISDNVDPNLYSVKLDSNKVYAIGSAELTKGPNAIRSPEDLQNHNILIHSNMTRAFDQWKKAVGLPDLQPANIDHLDSGPLMLEAAAQGLGIAIMHGGHFSDANDPRLVRLFDHDVDSPYSYWFVCRKRDKKNRAVRVFHDWVIKAGL
ncbi:LysR substrate-binding domain-containing protein [Parasphingorhabdus flavimaris]|uniref:LysR family transcriptional regulator n=1 Tax=Parasphingorhabdus flavimaris TaxID=266812 RepID=A0ABX2MYB5_9SPHN|nr:LysR substrate-binding domain-containing protein [Parasphingorhabdus flavimaris]NVD26444.1 LysR family transcriptional regulator [Parasphingorhabdus flavimaris]|tara:strand:- start:4135 stop:5013 length:879 start_codon:yes stop_codon:yes gene_type:complete